MNRRDFLRGASAVAVAASLPLPALARGGVTEFYNGGVREVVDLNAAARATLNEWASRTHIFEPGDMIYRGVIVRTVEKIPDGAISMVNVRRFQDFLLEVDDGH